MNRRSFLATLVGLAAVPLVGALHPTPSAHGYPRGARIGERYFDTSLDPWDEWVFTEAGWLRLPPVPAAQ